MALSGRPDPETPPDLIKPPYRATSGITYWFGQDGNVCVSRWKVINGRKTYCDPGSSEGIVGADQQDS